MRFRNSSHPRTTAEALVIGVRQGDQAAFAEIYDRHIAPTYGHARLLLGCPHAAEDVVQEVAEGVIKGIDRFDSARGSLHGWINGIAAKKAVDRLRADGRFRPEAPEAISRRVQRSTPAGALPEPAWLVEPTLLPLLRALPTAQRQVLVLRHLFGLSSKEAGQLLSRSPDSVRQLDSQACRALAERLAGRHAKGGQSRRARELGDCRVDRVAMRARPRISPVCLSRQARVLPLRAA